MTRQDQSVDTGGTAIQAGRDVVVQQGISAEQMAEIMVAVGKQLAVFTSEARQIADERIVAFQQSILARFAKPGEANPEAFKDPDFQYLLADAQEAVARSGDQAVRETLVDIIARRSMEKDRTRLALTLNHAAKLAANLTENEFAALSLVYLVRYTVRQVPNPTEFGRYVNANLIPFAKLVSRENASYWHIAAQSCGSVDPLGEFGIEASWRENYAGVLGKGFTRETLEAHLPEGMKHALDPFLLPCLNDPTLLQPNALTFEIFKGYKDRTGLTEDQLRNVWGAFQGTIPNIPDLLRPRVPDIDLLFEVWNSTPARQLSLTSTGIAIGHANASRVVGFNAQLQTWIK